MNYQSIQRLFDTPVCISCFAHYVDVKVEAVATSSGNELLDEIQRSIGRLLLSSRSGLSDEESRRTHLALFQEKLRGKCFVDMSKGETCVNCLNVIHPQAIETLGREIGRRVGEMLSHDDEREGEKEGEGEGGKEIAKVQLQFTIPSILDVSRVATRTFITQNVEKVVNFSTFDQLLAKMLSLSLPKQERIIVSDQADIVVLIKPCIANQLDISLAVYPAFQFKRSKRKFQFANHNNTVKEENDKNEEEDLPRTNIDKILLWIKTLKPEGIAKLFERLSLFIGGRKVEDGAICSFSLNAHYAPLYIFGRYCKFARDVPQSPWTLSNEPNKASDEQADEGEERKGRGSIEEIIAFEMKKYSLAPIVKLHACGREDIDVRCLGNGRPFALEILEAKKFLSSETLHLIAQNINLNQGLNGKGDIKILDDRLLRVDRAIWENMQSEAEEKKKGYACVVYVADGTVTKEKLALLEQRCRNGDDLDDEGMPCLQIMQRTPMRVMHRRSLMDRTRFVYDIQTVMINERYFLMNLVTSAGAYVKEFVHSDMGRTRPSVASWFDSPAEILQLDVVWLFDDFEKYSIANSGCDAVEKDKAEKQQSWTWLQQKRLGCCKN